MATTFPIAIDARTREENITLPQMRRAIPAVFLKPNALRSTWSLVRVIGSIGVCLYALSLIHFGLGVALAWKIPACVAVWILYGWVLVGAFVIGHDCGHQSFSTRRWLNTLVGYVCMAPLANSFRAWQVTHDDHHAYTLLRGREVDWASFLLTADELESPSKPDWITRLGYALPFGIAVWIAWNMLRRGLTIRSIIRHDVYARLKGRLLRSSAITAVVLAGISGGLWHSLGLWGLLKFYAIPATVATITGSVIITIQHANQHSLLYDRDEWTPFRGQMVSTFDVRFPSWIEYLWFDINIHIPHHLAPGIPWYYLKRVSRILRQAYPHYYQEQTFSRGHLTWWRRTPLLRKVQASGYYVLEPRPTPRRQWTRNQIHWLSRSVILAVVLASMGTLAFEPRGAFEYSIDILFRTYALFLGTVMAHEGIHGCLGRGKAANLWWARLALLPAMVPLTNFRKTHLLHHAYTNIPEKDPDYFVRPRNIFEIPLRATAMPHHWFFWLWKRGRVDRDHVVDLLLNYAGIFFVYSAMLLVAAPWRLVLGMVPALFLVSVLLWYPFAVKTHEGFSIGPLETRSHNYYGRFMYWFSLGLSMHRQHHLQPRLSWIELKDFVTERGKTDISHRFVPGTDMRLDDVGP